MFSRNEVRGSPFRLVNRELHVSHMPTADRHPKMRLRIMRGGLKLKAMFIFSERHKILQPYLRDILKLSILILNLSHYPFNSAEH